MNGDSMNNTDCPRAEVRPVNKPGLLLSVITLVICSVFIAACNAGYSTNAFFEAASIFAGAAATIALAGAALSPGLYILLGLTGFLSFAVFGTTVPWAFVTAAAAVISVFSALLCTLPGKYRWAVAAIPLAVYLIALPATLFDPLVSLNAVSLYPAAAALAFCQNRRRERVFSIIVCSALLITVLAVYMAAGLYRKLGTLDIPAITDYVISVRDEIAENIFSDLSGTFAEAGVEFEFTVQDMVYVIDGILAVLPAIFIIACNSLAFFAQRALFRRLERENVTELLTAETVTFRMSLQSAILFALSFVLFIAPSGSDQTVWRVISTASENIFLILTPGLFVSGLIQLRRWAAGRRIIFLPFVGILLLGFFGIFMILALACFGAAYIVFSSIKRKGDDNSQ